MPATKKAISRAAQRVARGVGRKRKTFGVAFDVMDSDTDSDDTDYIPPAREMSSDDENRKPSTSQQEPKKKRGRRSTKSVAEVDTQANIGYVGDIQSLPPEIWMRILRRSCVRENGVVEMCSVIKQAQICRASWLAHYDSRLYAKGVDLMTGIRADRQRHVLETCLDYLPRSMQSVVLSDRQCRSGEKNDENDTTVYETYKSLFTSCPKLCDLSIASARVPPKQSKLTRSMIEPLSTVVGQTLTCLQLTNFVFTDKAAATLKDALVGSLKKLEDLYLQQCVMRNSERVLSRPENWACIESLESLSVDGGQGMIVTIHPRWLIKAKKLNEINADNIDQVKIYRGDCLYEDLALTNLCIRAQNIGVEEHALSMLLARSPKLKWLEVALTCHTDSPLAPFFIHFRAFSTLTMLRLEHVNVDTSIDSADKCENAPLEKLSLEHMRNFDGLLAKLTRILDKNSKLKQISVAHSAGDMNKLKDFVTTIAPKVDSLDLSYCRMAPRGFKDKLNSEQISKLFQCS